MNRIRIEALLSSGHQTTILKILIKIIKASVKKNIDPYAKIVKKMLECILILKHVKNVNKNFTLKCFKTKSLSFKSKLRILKKQRRITINKIELIVKLKTWYEDHDLGEWFFCE